MKRKNPKVMKVDPEFKEWLKKRQGNIQKAIGIPIKVTMMDTQRIIAQTDGVELTKDMVRRVKKIEK